MKRDKPLEPEVIAKREDQTPAPFVKRRFPWTSAFERRSHKAQTKAVQAESELGRAILEHQRVGGKLADLETILTTDAAERHADLKRAEDEIDIAELEGNVRKQELLLRQQQLDYEFARRKEAQEAKEEAEEPKDPVAEAVERLKTGTKSFEDLKKMKLELDELVKAGLLDEESAETFYENIKDDLLNNLYRS